ncbi:hypothetical protein [Nocardioides sp. TF02-7]|uniref:hypothetical protein n=1 Tax=Nocardioides sp. TF02-7 TaxID=2917724 RepID=UPI001F05DE53|nr:hypothetical protein [Nocardioides sp. TF02-7]UMG94072.1 hypothetical protein MF408_08515 [Nocardioides sp. TF02-7]
MELVAGAPDAEGSPDLRLAAAVADLAQLLRRAAPYADRPVTLAAVRDRADALAEDGVPGAAQLVELAEQAIALE